MLVKLNKSFKTNTLCKLIHHGGDEGVTGSCHEFFPSKHESLLVDCGLFQGNDAPQTGNEHQAIDFDISNVKAVLLTHVHIDHVGRLPYLFAAGYRGPIFCTEASAKLLPLVMEDAVKIGFSAKPAMVRSFLKRLHQQLIPIEYGHWFKINLFTSAKVKVKFKPAGHILGSAYIEVEVRGEKGKEKTIFSGDLGAPYAPLLPAPKSPYSADRVVIESTYGDRLHQGRRERREMLRKIIISALKNKGTVIVPAFSIGRTQELLYELEELIHQYRNEEACKDLPWGELDIVVDSPLANRFTEVFKELKPFWDKEASRKVSSGRHPLSFDNLTTVNSHADHKKCVTYLAKTARPAIVLAASGMCAGGRVMNYLKAMISDARHDVLFVGYQAHGTPGHAIQKYGPKGGYVELDRKRYDIRAKIWNAHGYSAHADQKDLTNFIKRMRVKPKVVKLIHGDASAKKSLAKSILKACVSTELRRNV